MKKTYEKIKLFTDGGARGNPGPAGAGAVLKDPAGKEVVATASKFLGETTNNQAEYLALILGLEKAQQHGAKEVDAYMDSELAVKQLRREYKVKNEEIAKRFLEVWNLVQGFEKVRFHHVPREKNAEADALVNEAIDAHMG